MCQIVTPRPVPRVAHGPALTGRARKRRRAPRDRACDCRAATCPSPGSRRGATAAGRFAPACGRPSPSRHLAGSTPMTGAPMEPGPPLGSPSFSLRTAVNGMATHVTPAGELDIWRRYPRPALDRGAGGRGRRGARRNRPARTRIHRQLRPAPAARAVRGVPARRMAAVSAARPRSVLRLFELTQTLALLPFDASIPRQDKARSEAMRAAEAASGQATAEMRK